MNRHGHPEETYFTFSYSPVRGETEEVLGLFCSVVETTGRVLAERKIKEREAELIDILENTSDAFFTVDDNWILQRVNLQFEKIIKTKREDILGKNFLDLYFGTPELMESEYVKTYLKVKKEKKADVLVDFYEPFNIWTAILVYPKPDGGLAVFFREISEERRAAQELKDAILARDEFISIASHELKTPMTSLRLINEFKQHQIKINHPEAYRPESIDQYMVKTNDILSRMDRLIDDMLDISRIRTGKLTLRMAPADLVEVAKNVLEHFQAIFAAHSIEPISFQAPDQVLLDFDKMRIEQVIQNLLQNALKYGKGKKVEVFINDFPDKVQLTVKDQGMGVAPEKQQRIFERFERAVLPSEISGLGLGLYISSEILHLHQGNITLESTLGVGSSFTFELPKIP